MGTKRQPNVSMRAKEVFLHTDISTSDEHHRRSPECQFFVLINASANSGKPSKAKKGRTSRVSRASRLSTQSAMSVASVDPDSLGDLALGDLELDEGDTALTTATNATNASPSQKGRKKKATKAKKAPAAKSGKAKAKKADAVDSSMIEPEDDDFEVKVAKELPKPPKGRKRNSEEMEKESRAIRDDTADTVVPNPAPKRRATRSSMLRMSSIQDSAVGGRFDEDISMAEEEPSGHVSKAKYGKAGRRSRSSSISAKPLVRSASKASLRARAPDDEEIERALEADLDRPLTDDEEEMAREMNPQPKATSKGSTKSKSAPKKKAGRGSKVATGNEDKEIDEPAEVAQQLPEAEPVVEEEVEPMTKAKATKAKTTKGSKKKATKNQVDHEPASEAAVRAPLLDSSVMIIDESVVQPSSPIMDVAPKPARKGRNTGRQPSAQGPKRSTRASVLSTTNFDDSVLSLNPDTTMDSEDPGNETDASSMSQSTRRGGKATRRGSTLKKGSKGKKAGPASRHLEDIVHKEPENITQDIPEVEAVEDVLPLPTKRKGKASKAKKDETPEVQTVVDSSLITMEDFKAPNEEPKTKRAKAPKASKAKAAPVPEEQIEDAMDLVNPDPIPETIASPTPVKKATKAPKAKKATAPPPAPREATPDPQDDNPSDAENQPPSSRPASSRPPLSPIRHQAINTPQTSPSRQNTIGGLKSSIPWTAADLQTVFLQSPRPGKENVALEDAVDGVKGALSSPERKMTVEQWVVHNAHLAEERLRADCERMVGVFEREGLRALGVLEGVEVVE
jgi:hypothetical protein